MNVKLRQNFFNILKYEIPCCIHVLGAAKKFEPIALTWLFLDQNNVGQAMYHHGLCVLGQVTQAYQPAWYLMLPGPYMEQGLWNGRILSNCPIDRQQQWRPVGLLLRADVCSRYWSIATGPANARRITFRADIGGSTLTFRTHMTLPE